MKRFRSGLPRASRSSRWWMGLSLGFLPALAVMPGFGSVASASPVMMNGLKSELSLPLPQVRTAIALKGLRAQNVVGSLNWAGYADTGGTGTYKSITGQWTVPPLAGHSGYVGEWVGLGGFSVPDLIQTGTIEGFVHGQPIAVAFWEELPSLAVETALVPFGAQIQASIMPTGMTNTWRLTLTETSPTTQVLVNTTVTVDSAYAQAIGTSADWITEDPSSASGQKVPLADFGMVPYTGSTANNMPINALGATDNAIVMVNQAMQPVVVPSPLNPMGTGFITAYVGKPAGPSGPQGPKPSGPNPSGPKPQGPGQHSKGPKGPGPH